MARDIMRKPRRLAIHAAAVACGRRPMLAEVGLPTADPVVTLNILARLGIKQCDVCSIARNERQW